MKKAIWGAGTYGARKLVAIGADSIDFFIDTDILKKEYIGKKVVHPEEIKEWKDLYIYVPHNYADEISPFLKSKGMVENIDFEQYGHQLYIDKKKAYDSYDKYLMKLEKKKNYAKSIVAVWGRAWCIPRFMDLIIRMKDVSELLIISEAVWYSEEEIYKLTGINAITAPVFSDEESIVLCSSECDYYIEGVETNDIIESAEKQLQGIFPLESADSCKLTAELNYNYINTTLQVLGCNKIVCLGSVNVQAEILTSLCKRYGIELIYASAGCIHGTMAIDIGGEMGQSLPARYSKKFNMLPINNDDILNSRKICNYIYNTKINRKVQPVNDIENDIKARINPGRPIVLFLGQNDPFSHMIPYTERTREYHSPLFSSTIEAVNYIEKICKKNGWNLVYKPHPMYIQPDEKTRLSPETVYVESADINRLIDLSDVTVTILSTANYDALFRRKPSVVLGRLQSVGSGSNYDVNEKDEIESVISTALKEGWTEKHQEHFEEHVARLLKYYLYDDLQSREIRYGKEVPEKYEDFFELEKILTDDKTI